MYQRKGSGVVFVGVHDSSCSRCGGNTLNLELQRMPFSETRSTIWKQYTRKRPPSGERVSENDCRPGLVEICRGKTFLNFDDAAFVSHLLP
jgi:hypothetical protein